MYVFLLGLRGGVRGAETGAESETPAGSRSVCVDVSAINVKRRSSTVLAWLVRQLLRRLMLLRLRLSTLRRLSAVKTGLLALGLNSNAPLGGRMCVPASRISRPSLSSASTPYGSGSSLSGMPNMRPLLPSIS